MDRSKRFVILAIILWAASAVPVLAADDDITVVRDIAYREGESKAWRLDLAMKKDLTGKPRPGIVVIHGGGWLEGDKSSFVFENRKAPANIVDFAKLGFVAVTVNYRM